MSALTALVLPQPVAAFLKAYNPWYNHDIVSDVAPLAKEVPNHLIHSRSKCSVTEMLRHLGVAAASASRVSLMCDIPRLSSNAEASSQSGRAEYLSPNALRKII